MALHAGSLLHYLRRLDPSPGLSSDAVLLAHFTGLKQ
jgi:hypothetical protein